MKCNKFTGKFLSAALAVLISASLSGGIADPAAVWAAPLPDLEPKVFTSPQPWQPVSMVAGLQSPLVLPQPDLMAPVIDLATLSKSLSTAVPGDTVRLRVKVTDDNTGIQMVNFTLDNENGGYRKFQLTSPADDGYYTVDFLVDENTHHGQWTLSFLEAVDNNSNLTFYNAQTTDLTAANFSVNNPKADMTGPAVQISTLNASKTSAVPGDTVRIGVLAADDKNEIQSIQFYYINEFNASRTLVASTRNADGFYYGDFNVDESTHGGKWTLINIRAVDSVGNYETYSYYDHDLSKGNFTVLNDLADIIGPAADLSTLTVNRRVAYPGDLVTLKVKAVDTQSGVSHVEFDLHNEHGGIYTAVDYTRDSDGYYSMTFRVYETTQPGQWILNGISVYDNNKNFTGYWSSDTNLTQATFQVMESTAPVNPIDAIYIQHDTTWNYQVIEGDVYVGPDAHMTFGDVTIHGNLYILGSVESMVRLRADNVYAKSFLTDGQTSRLNGALSIVEGTYEFNLVQAAQPIPSIPIRVTSENQVTEAGVLPSLDGGIIPVADLYIDGVKTTYNYNGTFELNDLEAWKKDSVELKAVDVFGKTHVTTFRLDNPSLAQPTVPVIAGASRFLTANLISQAAYASADTAILVQGYNFPDALSAGPLAYALNAPILLTEKAKLTPSTQEELLRLGVKNVVILGGSFAIDPAVDQAIQDLGMTVERISGVDRYETALKTAMKLETAAGPKSSAFLASGLKFPDALAAGSVAARQGLPILLTDGNKLSQETLDYLTNKNIKQITLIGGTLVISPEIETHLKGLGIAVTRLGGETRAETSTLIAKTYFDRNLRAFAVNGWSFADGLATAPFAARLDAPILLAGKDEVDPSVTGYVETSSVRTIWVVGGDLVVGKTVRDQLLQSMTLQ